jgi:class 3 adenylate cyclase/predicted ATPase
MTFDDILDQVITLLKRQGRVSYGALKRRFDLDDAYLEDLKGEILFAYPVVDEEHRGLVWTGDTESVQAVAPPPSQPTLPSALQDQQSPQGAPLPAAPAPPEAERRQLTVLFCDLVDSTRLASQLDPEDYRAVVRAYQHTCAEVIQRFDGHIAQYLGDGLLVYFGYPQAHEDDAQRAVRTGIGIIEAMGALNTHLEQAKSIQLAVRLGIHTGLVVVGAMGGAGRQEQLALGEVPNVASRIQGLAEPNTVALSAATYHLVQGYFECQGLGEQTLRGVAEPIAVYRVMGESGAQSRLEVAATRGLTPLVGRESEVTLLLERWHQVKDGQGQVVLLSGEGGIGKSRLVQVVKDHVANEPHTRWECRSLPYYQNTALYPFIDFFQRALHWHQDETPEEKLAKLEQQLRQYRLPVAETVPLFAPLLSLTLPEDRYPPLTLSPQRQRQKTLESLVAMLLERAEREPVLFILEDLHWTDPTTLEFLSLLVEQVPTAALYMLLTCRPEFQPAWHHRSFLSEVIVNHLSRQQIEQMATHMAGGKALPADIIQQLVDKTDGVPLYVEEMSKALLESGHLKAVDGHYELTGTLPALAIPATLHDSLMARLDRLLTAKVLAQLGATIGRQFSYALLKAVSQGDEATLQTDLRRLVEAEIVYQRGLPPQATYIFKHALIQDAAYESLLKSTRQHSHQRIAQVVEAQFPATVETQPELLAHHFTEAGLNEQASGYWYRAGVQAGQRSANTEAIAHFTQGLALLQALPESPERRQRELVLQTALGASLIASKGYAAPEVEQVYKQAWALCQQVGESPQLLPILSGLRRVYTMRAEFQIAQELGERILTLAQCVNQSVFLLEAHYALGSNAFWSGDLLFARAHLAQGLALELPPSHTVPTPLYGQDPRVACLASAALTSWLLGYPTQALQQSQEALTVAHRVSHPNTLAYALMWASFVHQHRREVQTTQRKAEELITLSEEQGFQLWLGTGTCQWGWALAMQGKREGLLHMRHGQTTRLATSPGVAPRPQFFASLAEAYGIHGQADAGLAVITEGQDLVAQMGGHHYAAELHRLKGQLLLQRSSDNHAEAETCFQHAISIAQRQHAKSWELRAATSLARLWQQQGKRADAYDLLTPIYGWFTEGWDTADLQEAKALLDALG